MKRIWIAAALALLPVAAQAEGVSSSGGTMLGPLTGPAGSWTGVYVGIDGGMSVLDANASRIVKKGTKTQNEDEEGDKIPDSYTYTYGPDPISILNADNFGGREWTYGVRVGFDWQVRTSPFVIGVLGGYGWGKIDSSMSFAEDTWASDIEDVKGASFSIEPTWYAGGRIGLVLQKTSLAYIGAAWTQAEVDGAATIAYRNGEAPTSFSASDTINGYMLLAGLETQIAPQITLGAEYSYTRFDDVTFSGPHVEVYSGSVRQNSLHVEPDVHAFKVRLNWRPMQK